MCWSLTQRWQESISNILQSPREMICSTKSGQTKRYRSEMLVLQKQVDCRYSELICLDSLDALDKLKPRRQRHLWVSLRPHFFLDKVLSFIGMDWIGLDWLPGTGVYYKGLGQEIPRQVVELKMYQTKWQRPYPKWKQDHLRWKYYRGSLDYCYGLVEGTSWY